MKSFPLRWLALLFLGAPASLSAETSNNTGTLPVTPPSPAVIALVGGTLIDLSHFGTSHADVPRAIIIVRGNTIEAVGAEGGVTVPFGARTIDISGKFIVPGLIDGYCGMSSQAHANAFLYMGVTSIVAKSDSRRGVLYTNANPGPRVFEIASAGVEVVAKNAAGLRDVAGTQKLASAEETLWQIDDAAKRGAKVLHLLYPLTPERVRLITQRAKELGLVTVAELGATTYTEAAEAGVTSFVHTSRYRVELAPRYWLAEYARDSFGSDAAEQTDNYLDRFDTARPEVLDYGKILASSPIGLMPTHSLTYLSFPDHRNLWQEPVATLLDPATLHLPPDRATGNPALSPRTGKPVLAHRSGAGERLMAFDRVFHAAGAHYLVGTGTPALGTMPGISVHTELELLTRAGLSPREALAAATENFAEIYGWHEVGRIAPGAWADVLVLDADPTTDIARAKAISLLMKNGEIIDRQQLLNAPPPSH